MTGYLGVGKLLVIVFRTTYRLQLSLRPFLLFGWAGLHTGLHTGALGLLTGTSDKSVVEHGLYILDQRLDCRMRHSLPDNMVGAACFVLPSPPGRPALVAFIPVIRLPCDSIHRDDPTQRNAKSQRRDTFLSSSDTMMISNTQRTIE
jgi:hypothetical protein